MRVQPITDHLGNDFSSKREMCLHYHITQNVYARREQRGWSLERILTTPVKPRTATTAKLSSGFILDHLTREYPDLPAMCKAYQIDLQTFYDRKNKGWKLETILTTPMGEGDAHCVDHKGRVFASANAMCDHYGISYPVYHYRIQNGWSLEQTLTTSVGSQRTTCHDHLGQEFSSLTEMCSHHGIPFKIYQNRIRYGWSVERALSTPVQKKINKRPDAGGK